MIDQSSKKYYAICKVLELRIHRKRWTVPEAKKNQWLPSKALAVLGSSMQLALPPSSIMTFPPITPLKLEHQGSTLPSCKLPKCPRSTIAPHPASLKASKAPKMRLKLRRNWSSLHPERYSQKNRSTWAVRVQSTTLSARKKRRSHALWK